MKRVAKRNQKQHIYINEYYFDGGDFLVKTYLLTRKELEKMEDYVIIHMDDEKLTAAICKEDDKEAIEAAL